MCLFASDKCHFILCYYTLYLRIMYGRGLYFRLYAKIKSKQNVEKKNDLFKVKGENLS